MDSEHDSICGVGGAPVRVDVDICDDCVELLTDRVLFVEQWPRSSV